MHYGLRVQQGSFFIVISMIYDAHTTYSSGQTAGFIAIAGVGLGEYV